MTVILDLLNWNWWTASTVLFTLSSVHRLWLSYNNRYWKMNIHQNIMWQKSVIFLLQWIVLLTEGKW